MPYGLWGRGLILAFGALAFLGAFGCQALSVIGADQKSLPNLQLTAVVDQQVLYPGDTATVTVAVVNQADTAVTISGSSTCLLWFEVIQPSGALVYAAPQGCTRDLYDFTIAPHGTLQRSFRWRGQAHSTSAPSDRLPVGRYEVVGRLRAITDRGTGTELLLMSAPQPVEIREE